MVIYDSAYIYIDKACTLADKIKRIDAIIDGLFVAATKAASGENISEYSLNDGQTQIKTVYKGTEAIYASIKAFETLKEMYANKLNGRVIRLVDSKNFIGRHGGR